MSAGSRLKESVIAVLANHPAVPGVFDGPPVRTAFPYVQLDTGSELDWSHKSGAGREIGLALTIWDDQPSRLERLSDEVEAKIEEVGAMQDWTLVSLRFVRRRVIRDVAGPWATALDYRARLLKNNEGV